jgi:hypothetical protein
VTSLTKRRDTASLRGGADAAQAIEVSDRADSVVHCEFCGAPICGVGSALSVYFFRSAVAAHVRTCPQIPPEFTGNVVAVYADMLLERIFARAAAGLATPNAAGHA